MTNLRSRHIETCMFYASTSYGIIILLYVWSSFYGKLTYHDNMTDKDEMLKFLAYETQLRFVKILIGLGFIFFRIVGSRPYLSSDESWVNYIGIFVKITSIVCSSYLLSVLYSDQLIDPNPMFGILDKRITYFTMVVFFIGN